LSTNYKYETGYMLRNYSTVPQSILHIKSWLTNRGGRTATDAPPLLATL